MCIRDRKWILQADVLKIENKSAALIDYNYERLQSIGLNSCLLYTSDAADERSSVDLGGRRIIKKKKCTIPRSERMSKKTIIEKKEVKK